MDTSQDLKTTCPSCENHVAYPVEYAGQSTECPHCGTELQLPIPQKQRRWLTWVLLIVFTPSLLYLLFTAVSTGKRNHPALPTPAAGIQTIKQKAEAGDPQAQFELGYHTATGQLPMKGSDGFAVYDTNLFKMNTPSDQLAKAISSFEQAASKRHVDAQYILGMLSLRNLEVLGPNVGLDWLQSAAKQNHPSANYMLFAHLTIAAEEGSDIQEPFKSKLQAMISAGAKHSEYLQRAAELGHLEAIYRLGRAYFAGAFGFPKDQSKGLELMERAAQHGYVEAEYDVALIYKVRADETGSIVDDKKAFEWFWKAANRGVPAAQHSLSRFFSSGRGTAKDPKEWVRWTKAAATNGVTEAQLELALFYTFDKGEFVNRD